MIKNLMKRINLCKLFVLFIIMGLLYLNVEAIFRTLTITGLSGFTKNLELKSTISLWMFLVGGICGICLGLINEIKSIRNNFNMFFQALIGGIIVTVVEFVSGCILNLWFGFGIWDYTHLPLNILGQISIVFLFFWIILAPFVFWMDDVLRNLLYGESKIYDLGSMYLSLFKIWEKPYYVKYQGWNFTKLR